MEDENQENDVVAEDLDDSVVAEEHAQESVSKLRGKLKEMEGKAKEYLDGWQRSQADFVNLRKRDEEAKIDFLKFANASFIEQLIPVLDSFNLALAHGNKEIEPVYNQLMNVLKQNGLEESNPLGETFDPRMHEAIGVVKTEKKDEDHKILEIMQKGYIMSGKIIRPAKVRIGEFSDK